MSTPPAWTWILADANGNSLCELTTASGRQIAHKRNGAPEASFTLSYQDDAAQVFMDALYGSSGSAAGIPHLKCYRKGPNDSAAVLRFNGYMAPFTDQSENESTLTPVFRGPFSTLLGDGEERGRFTDDSEIFNATDAGQIAKTLIDNRNAVGSTMISTGGNIEATKPRDRAYQNANVGQAIVDLSSLLDGFDFEVTPIDSGSVIGQFVVYAKQGVDRPAARFEYGPETLANVRQLTRTIAPPVNATGVIGANGLTSFFEDKASQATYGRWPVQVSASDVDEQAILDDKAHGLLRPAPVKTLSFTPDLALSPRPWDDFWLGDAVRVYARREALSENATVRVNAITVVIDDNGYETAEIPDPTTPGQEAVFRANLQVEVSATA